MTHRTTRGRVVYSRAKHVFRLRDAARILRRVEIDREDPAELLALAQILENALFLAVERAATSGQGEDALRYLINFVRRAISWIIYQAQWGFDRLYKELRAIVAQLLGLK